MEINQHNVGESHLMIAANKKAVKINEMSIKTVLLSDIIDAILAKSNHSIQLLMKIDIEGNECNAFLGSSQVLSNQKTVSIIAVIMEWTFSKWPKRCTDEKVLQLKTLFLDAGYIPFYIHDQSLIKLAVDKNDWNRNAVVWIQDQNIIRSMTKP